jgi:hypothetical protein
LTDSADDSHYRYFFPADGWTGNLLKIAAGGNTGAGEKQSKNISLFIKQTFGVVETV